MSVSGFTKRLGFGVCGVLAAPLLLSSCDADEVISSLNENAGTLSVSSGSTIYDWQLALHMWGHIPDETQKLVILTECYGGDTAGNVGAIPNTAVISATSPGELACYGGYDDEAAEALKPGGGTGQDVHDAGAADACKTPMVDGGLSPGDFSLEAASETGNIRGRRILVFAGQPNALDDSFRDTIVDNFSDEPNTTVLSVGASGTDGWDYPGTLAGLVDALGGLSAEIAASPDPSQEQFILYVTDHGGFSSSSKSGPVELPSCQDRSCSEQLLVEDFQAFSGDARAADLLSDADAQPGFSLFVDLAASGLRHDARGARFLSEGDLVLSIAVGDETITLSDFEERPREIGEEGASRTDDGLIGDETGEGIELFFPVSTEEFVSRFFNNELRVSVVNNTEQSMIVDVFAQESGPVVKQTRE